jgi:hypothetical protein
MVRACVAFGCAVRAVARNGALLPRRRSMASASPMLCDRSELEV